MIPARAILRGLSCRCSANCPPGSHGGASRLGAQLPAALCADSGGSTAAQASGQPENSFVCRLWREKPEAEGFVVYKIFAIPDSNFFEQHRIITVIGQS